MSTDLKGKVILVTGSSTGIGAAAARAFGHAGARVAVHYNASEAAARQVAGDVAVAGGAAEIFRGDLMQPNEPAHLVQAVRKHFGRIDVLVNNAGNVFDRKPFSEWTPAEFDAMLQLNVRSVVAMCQAIIGVFRAQGGGNIINVTSIAARNGGGPGVVLYAATKGFISTLTRGLAKEFVADRVRVNGVAPGVILTPLHDRHTTQATLDALKGTVPMGRLGSADECAGAFVYLASDALSSYVTGQIIEVNGGQLMP
ncbi:MAG TPA: SDR family oxidoreductase [Burkholderiaceae bacterium]|nr:SDR family oxidoreductase [Burkholderiaceae bacterium]